MGQVVFVTAPPQIEINLGMARITSMSGDQRFESIMSAHDLMVSVEQAHRAIVKWQNGQSPPTPLK